MSAAAEPLTHPLLERRGVEHGFGVKGWAGPAGLVRPVQVHGVAVAVVASDSSAAPEEADAIVSETGGPPVGVVTADCVPILVAAADGGRVAAIHAGWRGLAAGVIEAAVARLAGPDGTAGGFAAVIGPHAGPCCYEIDAPVRDAFAAAEAPVLARAFRPSRPGHWMLELSCLVRAALERSGVPAADVGSVDGACTVCDPARFESYRRDGSAAGRLVHAIRPGGA